jgi:hypothetical protein
MCVERKDGMSYGISQKKVVTLQPQKIVFRILSLLVIFFDMPVHF